METLTINIPDKKSALVKQILKGLGVTIQGQNKNEEAAYKKKLLEVTVWSSDDLRHTEAARMSFETLKPQQW